MTRKAFTEHPEFMKAGRAANQGLHQALFNMGLDDKAIFSTDLEDAANRVVDDLTRLLLRAYDARQKKNARPFDQHSSQDTPGFVEAFRVMP